VLKNNIGLKMKIEVAGRESPLSKAQIEEVFQELFQSHKSIVFEKTFLKTSGDIDLKTSLKDLDKTDFFTKQIDECLLNKKCRIAIHSAKDLPKIIPEGLTLIAITKGLDPIDSLVLKEGMTLDSLKNKAVIGTSSVKREEALKNLRPDFTFKDIRGQIMERLELLQNSTVDGVIIAEAALIRLKLEHLNRVKLEYETTPLQGRLAIIARDDDIEMKELFSCIDSP